MKFNIRDIGPNGLRVNRTLKEGELRQLVAPSGLEIGEGPASLALDLLLERTDASSLVILLRGKLKARFEVSCSRCLGPASLENTEESLRLIFFPRAPRVNAERELSAEDLDTYTYDGEEIELEPVLREFVILGVPMAPVCREDCKGICGGCGADLNKEPCRCADKEAETPWAEALRRLKQTS